MEAAIIKLSNGIAIHDQRASGCGIRIENQNAEYMTLGYASNRGFYLNMKGFILTIDDMLDYEKELKVMRLALVEANDALRIS